MSTNGLSPPGTSTYSSDNMFVGDGTWDSERNSFLLPNLQGLNFAMMQYNGMGNRFRDLPQYHVLIIGHGVLAAIVFIFMIPGAIFIARFWHSKSRQAFKLHVYIQILVVFLSTVILILGWFAVGPERSLTNPHHGIGVALYVCILAQFLWGWLMYKHERKRTSPPIKLPLRIHIHRLFGQDEKHGQKPATNTWRDRFLGAGAGVAALIGAKSLFDRRKNREKGDHDGYRPPRGGEHSMVSQTDVSRVEAGQAPFSPPRDRRYQEVQSDTLTPMSPSRLAPKRRPSVYTLDESDDESHVPRRRPGAGEDNTLKASIAALGFVAGVREWNKNRKQRQISEQAERIRQQEIEEERRYKRNSSHHYPLPEHAQGRRTSMSGTLMTGPEPTMGSNPELSRQNFRAINPDPSRLLSQEFVQNSSSNLAGTALAAGALGAAGGAAAAAHPRPPSHSSPRYNDSRTRLTQPNRQSSFGSNSMSQLNPSAAGPSTASGLPVSVKVKMHNDGRHVTLRRLNEQEAAAEREARRVGTDAGGNGRRARRGSSLSSGGEDAGASRFRRGSNAIRPSSQQPIAAASASPPIVGAPGLQQQPVSPSPHQGLSPAPGPASSGAIVSPGNITSDVGTGTDVSAFDNNRRRRRAERARRDAAAKGARVEFE
ncbi:uncharacterized protein K489DRAFT_349555 [Dissoconium aciculare CBS 342.82]|uniref:Cytochrome b561 domain-containing protein n=1 Tax=Dissoconium aciculare CBS 342.82 TaxID=1314786 RepID=A0A6J3MIV6_9PEZI|nr:uncharacterized protein K489DRAFT_349555 [Dissoconium aciculare CBS 342.82]KAF1827843.1 hypothetical protein K489DRAFT_349555 [Dissoconium aciculare CBS 342.82]